MLNDMTLFYWRKKLNYSLQTGKGTYKYSYVCDIHEELKLSQLLLSRKYKEAIKLYVKMEELFHIPWAVINFLEKKIRETSKVS